MRHEEERVNKRVRYNVEITRFVEVAYIHVVLVPNFIHCRVKRYRFVHTGSCLRSYLDRFWELARSPAE